MPSSATAKDRAPEGCFLCIDVDNLSMCQRCARAYSRWQCSGKDDGTHVALMRWSANRARLHALKGRRLEQERAFPVYRCKAIKPGDKGVVDGCGWQGTTPGIDARKCFYCPDCGSRILRVVA